MARQRPAIITIFAIINLVLGGFGLLQTTLSLILVAMGLNASDISGSLSSMFMDDKFQRQTMGFTQREMMDALFAVPGMKESQWSGVVLEGTLSILLIVGALGMLRLVNWGWWLTMFYALLNIVYRTFGVYFATVMLSPAMVKFFQEKASEATNPQQKMQCELQASLFPFTSTIGGVLAFIYPLLILLIMLLPVVRRAFRGEPDPVAPVPPDYDEEREE